MPGARNVELVRYPDGMIVRVTLNQIRKLSGEGIAFYDDDPVNPPPQWGYHESDESRVRKILRRKEGGK